MRASWFQGQRGGPDNHFIDVGNGNGIANALVGVVCDTDCRAGAFAIVCEDLGYGCRRGGKYCRLRQLSALSIVKSV